MYFLEHIIYDCALQIILLALVYEINIYYLLNLLFNCIFYVICVKKHSLNMYYYCMCFKSPIYR